MICPECGSEYREGFFQLGTFDPVAGPVAVQVPREHEEAAREILAPAGEALPLQEEEDGE